MTKLTSSRWFAPTACIAIGFAFLIAGWKGGDAEAGLVALGVMAAIAAAVALAELSGIGRGFAGSRRDERFRAIDSRAGAVMGLVLVGTLVLLSLARLSRGYDIDPYGMLLAIAAATYALTLAYLHWRG